MQATGVAQEHAGDYGGVPAAEKSEDGSVSDDLLERARQEDQRHRERYQRPVSAENLRKALGVGAERSRTLVKLVRAEQSMSA